MIIAGVNFVKRKSFVRLMYVCTVQKTTQKYLKQVFVAELCKLFIFSVIVEIQSVE